LNAACGQIGIPVRHGKQRLGYAHRAAPEELRRVWISIDLLDQTTDSPVGAQEPCAQMFAAGYHRGHLKRVGATSRQLRTVEEACRLDPTASWRGRVVEDVGRGDDNVVLADQVANAFAPAATYDARCRKRASHLIDGQALA